MNVALLVCEETPAYDRLFRDLLESVPEGADITLHPYAACRGILPSTVHDHEGYIITGSYAGVYEAHPWISRLLEFVRRAHGAAIPLVGVCFGHQVLARILGGRVEKARTGWELGVRTTRITRRQSWMGTDAPAPEDSLQLIYIHQDQVVTVPPEAQVFARTDRCPVAGFVLGDSGEHATVLGLQGHPEFTPATAETIIRSQPGKFTPEVAGPALETLSRRRRPGGESGTENNAESGGDTGDGTALLPDAITLAGWIARFLLEARGPEVERLARAIRYRTVLPVAPSGRAVFDQFEEFLRHAFPDLHRNCTVEQPGDPGLLFTWPGSDPGADPLLFLAHYDVVPADPEGWHYPPFSGAVAEGCVWGRGALDDKGPLMALLEATENLIREGYIPRRTIMIALGGDEETGGSGGAVRIAEDLARRGIVAHATFDEGSVVAEGMIPLVKRPLALIGTAEKGYLDVCVSAEETGGHAAMPGRRTALGRVAAAVTRINQGGFPLRMPSATASFLRCLGSGGRGPGAITAFLLRHPRLFAPLLCRALRSAPTSNALVRTTVAPTMARGSAAPNVLPARAEMTLNLRLLPGTDRPAALARLRALAGVPVAGVADATRTAGTDVVITELPGGSDPVPDSPVDTKTYRILEDVTAAHFPTAIVAPFLVTVTTDSRHYHALSRAIYRFVPIPLDPARLSSIHGINERIAIRDYRRAISWYYDCIRTLGACIDE
ncbi:MAG: M20/M25/M40 family metallo-hydrolase [Spirochaetaceae bacterium]|nr:MAG: M20/M25/M40 family metallo-hydrolase [Spirochaetaceae bacterium]